jgi:ribokinase
VPGTTGCASICTDALGRNQIVVAPGANAAARAEGVEDAFLGPGTIVLTQMEVDTAQTEALIRRARALGARIIHNLAPAARLASDALRLLDILVVNEDEATWLARQEGVPASDAVSLHRALGMTIVRTLGADGVEWAGGESRGRIAAAPVRAIDTTAAGDCFVGVLAAALDRGVALADALFRANAAAGLACMREGSQGSLPRAAMIDEILEQRGSRL